MMPSHTEYLFTPYLRDVHPTVSVVKTIPQPLRQVVVQGNVVVVVGAFLGQHPPGQPSVVVLSKRQLAWAQPGRTTWAVQPDSKAVKVVVGHGAGVKTVSVWKPVGLGRNRVLGILGQVVVIVVDRFPRLCRRASAVGAGMGIGSEIEGWRRLRMLSVGENWGIWSSEWL